MEKTLSEGLKPAYVDFETLHKRYNPLLGLVRELIGVIPNCDPILEIWPPGFRTYNLLVPNLFNLPNMLLDKKSLKASIGLAMYASSKAACAYCTAHSCSFALRRGARKDAFIGSRTTEEQAVVALAEGLAEIPAHLTLAEVEAVREHFSPSETEWLMFSISMMGFLNKFMHVMSIELEQGAINDTAALLTKTGWTPGLHVQGDLHSTKDVTPKQDGILTYLRLIRHAPGAVLWEKKWFQGVPGDYFAASKYLNEHTGYSFPLLTPIGPERVIRTLTAVLRDNLDKKQTTTGLKIKMLAGYIFTVILSNDTLIGELKNLMLSTVPELNEAIFGKLEEVARMELPTDTTSCLVALNQLQQQLSLTEIEAAATLLTVAASYIPAPYNDALIDTIFDYLEPSNIVEIVVWLSVVQLLHRMSVYYEVVNAY